MSLSYTPFGELWIEEASSVEISQITRLFTNQMYDKESGLYYMNARYYDPDIAMFTTSDPAMSGANHYAYANCNPVMYSDPTGLWDYRPGELPTTPPPTTTTNSSPVVFPDDSNYHYYDDDTGNYRCLNGDWQKYDDGYFNRTGNNGTWVNSDAPTIPESPLLSVPLSKYKGVP